MSSNYAAAGASPAAISVPGTVTNPSVWRNDIHDIGAATRISGTGGAGCVVRDDKVVAPTTNADTSGATLAALETEVNELKALLRSVGLML